MLLLSLALAQDYTPPTEAEVRALLIESRQLDACRAREVRHLDLLEAARSRALDLHAQVGACLDASREDDAELVAQVDALTEALERSERRRGRLRTVVVGLASAAVVVAVAVATR